MPDGYRRIPRHIGFRAPAVSDRTSPTVTAMDYLTRFNQLFPAPVQPAEVMRHMPMFGRATTVEQLGYALKKPAWDVARCLAGLEENGLVRPADKPTHVNWRTNGKARKLVRRSRRSSATRKPTSE